MLLLTSIILKVIFTQTKAIRKLTLLLLRIMNSTVQNLLELKVKSTNQNLKQRIKGTNKNGSTTRRLDGKTNQKYPIFQHTYYKRMIYQSKEFHQQFQKNYNHFLTELESTAWNKLMILSTMIATVKLTMMMKMMTTPS